MTETEKPTPPPAFKIETPEDLWRVMTIAKGGNPDAIQAVAEFMDLKSNAERSYFPNKLVTLAVAQLKGYGRNYFPNDDWNPYDLVGDAISISFMGFKGFKSNQFVEMTRTQPNLDALKSAPEEVKQGFISRMLGRSGSE